MTKPHPAQDTPPTEPGQAAPAFDLLDQSGQRHRLKDYRGRWTVLYFYPKDSTPGCTKEACGFRDAQGPLEQREAAVLGVSPDGQASHQRFAVKHGLPFPLLVDEGAEMCRAYGVWRPKKMFGREFLGVARTTYLIDPAGDVAHRWDKVKVAGHVEQVLAKLDELAG